MKSRYGVGKKQRPLWELGAGVGASAPTRTSEGNARTGMPTLPGAFELGPDLNITLAGAAQNRWKLDLRLPVRAAITLERDPRFIGTTFSPNLNLDLKDVGAGWSLGLLTGPLFADAEAAFCGDSRLRRFLVLCKVRTAG